VLGFAVNVLGMLQSVARYLLLPLAIAGGWMAVRRNWAITSLLFATILYYLGPGCLAHTEIRYVLTLHWLLPIFAGLAVVAFGQMIRNRRSSHVRPVGDPA
jgi:hypothetical protein